MDARIETAFAQVRADMANQEVWMLLAIAGMLGFAVAIVKLS